MSAHQTTSVHVRGHDFTVDYLPNAGALPTIIHLFLSEYPDDVINIINPEVMVLICIEAQKRQTEKERCIAHAIELERLDP